MWCINFLLILFIIIGCLPKPNLAYNRDFIVATRAQACSLDSSIITNLKALGILKKRGRGRGGSSKVSAFFYNVNGREKLERSLDNKLDLNKIGNHSFVFLSETWLTEKKSSSLFPDKDFFVEHAEKNARGRPFGGIEMYVSKHLQATP